MATAKKAAKQRVTRRGPRAARGRPDPKPRSLNGIKPWGTVYNKDPAYEYLFCRDDDQQFGLAEQKALGWEEVLQPPDGDKTAERLAGGTTSHVGDPIRSRGLILVRRHKKWGDQTRKAKREMMRQLEQQLMGASIEDQRDFQRNLMGVPVPTGHPAIRQSALSTREAFVDDDPYPAFTE